MRLSDKAHIRIPLIYAVIGIIWVPATDLMLKLIDLSLEKLLIVEIVKGLFFILLTTLILYCLLKKQKELQLAEEERQKLYTLIDTMPDFVVFKDGTGKWLQANRFALNLLTLDEQSYRGKTNAALASQIDFLKDTFVFCEASDGKAWESMGIYRSEEDVVQRNGTVKTFDIFKVPIFNKNKSRKGLLVIGRDVTELKETEQLLRQSEKLSVVGELAAGVAHEIRNPLTSVKGFIQLMSESSNVNKEHMTLILSELDRINEIVTELLLVAKPQKTDYANFNIQNTVQSVLSFLSTEFSLKNVYIVFQTIEEETFIYGSERQLKQVFINIIKNSLDSIEHHGTISISVSAAEGWIEVEMADNGCGIDEDRLKRIGEPFYSSKEKGIGLGMTVSFRIIESHKGTISISSQLNKGTTVKISLPALT